MVCGIFGQLTSHFSTTNLPLFLIFSPYNQIVLPAHLQLSLSNALQIPLGSKFLTDLSTFKLLHFGMLYHTIFALILILLNLILFSHYITLHYFITPLTPKLTSGASTKSYLSFIGELKQVSFQLFFKSSISVR